MHVALSKQSFGAPYDSTRRLNSSSSSSSSTSAAADQPDAAGERGQSFHCRGGPVAPLGDGERASAHIHTQRENRNLTKNRNVISS